MKAFLLAAGRGKRLLPYTQDNPKPLIMVGGMSLIERNIKKANQRATSKEQYYYLNKIGTTQHFFYSFRNRHVQSS